VNYVRLIRLCLRLGVSIAVGIVVILLISLSNNTEVLERKFELVEKDENGAVTGLKLTHYVAGDRDTLRIAEFLLLRRLTFEGIEIDDPLMDRICRLPNLISISFPECRFTGKQLSKLQATGIRHLNLSRTTGIEDGITGIGGLSRLERLDLTGCQWISDIDLSELSRLPMLKELMAAETPISDKGFETLVELPHLERLNVAGCTALTDSVLLKMPEQSSLRSLSVADLPIRLAVISGLQTLRPDVSLNYNQGLAPDIQFLLENSNPGPPTINSIDAEIPAGQDLTVLKYLSELNSVRLVGSGVDDSVMPFLAQMRQLRALDLSNSRIAGGLATLPVVESLESVALNNCHIPQNVLQWLANLPNLKYLNLNRTTVLRPDSETAHAGPMEFRYLVQLHASDSRLPFGSMRLHAARFLRLDGCGLTDEMLQNFEWPGDLQTLDLARNPLLGDPALIGRLKPVRFLNLANTEISDDSLKHLKLPSDDWGVILDLSATKISSSGLANLSSTRIGILKVRRITFTEESMSILASLAHLKCLDIRGCLFPSDLWSRLEELKKLTNVAVSGTFEVTQPLCESQLASRINSLVLDKPTQESLDILGRFPSLNFLGLTECHLEDSHAMAIQRLPGLTSLSLHRCELSPEAIETLFQNSQLKLIRTSDEEQCRKWNDSGTEMNPRVYMLTDDPYEFTMDE